MIYVKRTEHFNAAHKLYNPNWSQEQNEAVFGPCANKNWHGHNFKLTVTVKGHPNPQTGFVIDLKKLGDVIDKQIIDIVDHRNLNEDVSFLKGKMTSCEVIIVEFWNILAPAVKKLAPAATLHSLTLQETPKNVVEYFGDPVNMPPVFAAEASQQASLNPKAVMA